VIPLLLDQSGWASLSPFLPLVEADNPWKLHDTRDHVQHVSWAVIRSDEETYVKLTPAHQVGDVATRHLQRADVAEDSRPVQLVKERSRLRLQRRLPSRQLIVASRRSHDSRC
jgi:hypothetical protein